MFNIIISHPVFSYTTHKGKLSNCAEKGLSCYQGSLHIKYCKKINPAGLGGICQNTEIQIIKWGNACIVLGCVLQSSSSNSFGIIKRLPVTAMASCVLLA